MILGIKENLRILTHTMHFDYYKKMSRATSSFVVQGHKCFWKEKVQ